MGIFWVFTVCGGFTRSIVIFEKLFSQCMHFIYIINDLLGLNDSCVKLISTVNEARE